MAARYSRRATRIEEADEVEVRNITKHYALYRELDSFWDIVEEEFRCEIYAFKLMDSRPTQTVAYIGIKNASQELVEFLNRRCRQFLDSYLSFKKVKGDNQNTQARERSTHIRENQLNAREHVQEKNTNKQNERIEKLEAEVQGLTNQVLVLSRELKRAINTIQEHTNHSDHLIHEMSGAVETTRELVGDLAEQISLRPAQLENALTQPNTPTPQTRNLSTITAGTGSDEFSLPRTSSRRNRAQQPIQSQRTPPPVKAPVRPPIIPKSITTAERRYRLSQVPNLAVGACCHFCTELLINIPDEQLLQCTCCKMIRCTPCQQNINEKVDMSRCPFTKRMEFELRTPLEWPLSNPILID